MYILFSLSILPTIYVHVVDMTVEVAGYIGAKKMLSLSQIVKQIYTSKTSVMDNVPVKSKLKHPPSRQTPGHFNFWKIFAQIPPSRGQKAVQMPHHRSIPGDQMTPPSGNVSVAFIMLRKLCM